MNFKNAKELLSQLTKDIPVDDFNYTLGKEKTVLSFVLDQDTDLMIYGELKSSHNSLNRISEDVYNGDIFIKKIEGTISDKKYITYICLSNNETLVLEEDEPQKDGFFFPVTVFAIDDDKDVTFYLNIQKNTVALEQTE